MTLRAAMLDKLWRDRDPFVGAQVLPRDCTGWNSDHQYLRDAGLDGVAIEVGCWKGAGVATIAQAMRDADADGCVIAVDTWLGSAEHWRETPRRPDGYPRLYELFLSNMMHEGVVSYVAPVPLDSASAATMLAEHGIMATAIHIDASHDYASCIVDLRRWWPLLIDGGTMIVDDYGSTMWRDVQRAVDDFRVGKAHLRFEAGGNKCRFVKG